MIQSTTSPYLANFSNKNFPNGSSFGKTNKPLFLMIVIPSIASKKQYQPFCKFPFGSSLSNSKRFNNLIFSKVLILLSSFLRGGPSSGCNLHLT